MALSHVQFQPLGPAQAGQAEADEAVLRRSALGDAAGVAQTDAVVFDSRLDTPQLQAMILERVLSRVEVEPDIDETLFAATGKADFQTRASEATDTSPQGTANRIVEGVTGYIYEAFALQHPDMTEEQVLEHIGLRFGRPGSTDCSRSGFR